MATSSEVKSGLDKIAEVLSAQRDTMKKAKVNATNASAALASLPTDFAGVIATINAYGTSNAFEALAKAELAKMTTEFTALKSKADQVAALDLDS